MPASTAHSSATAAPGNHFPATHWSVVLSAGSSNTPHARDALEKLCRTYWYPLYGYARRRGLSPEDAKDLTQECFARLLEQQSISNADPQRGKFRSFMLGAMNHCLANHWTSQHAQKRGGDLPPISLDWAAAEHWLGLEPADDRTPDKAFDQRWASALLNEVLTALESDYRREGKAALFDALRQTLVGVRESQPYAALAARLGLSEGATRIAVHRLRKRYRERVRDEIANTVSSPAEVDEEIRYLFKMSAG